MKKLKIMAIVYKVDNGDLYFLALRNNPKDKCHGGDYYFVVTGYVNKNEKLEGAVKREIKEETGIRNILSITDMNKIYNYDWDGDKCEEHVFSVKIDGEVKKLNFEHIGYKWLQKEDFIKTVKWDDKNDLRQILEGISAWKLKPKD